MARRSGQVGYEEVKSGWYHVRFRKDVPGRAKRGISKQADMPHLRSWFLTKPERVRKRREIIAASGADTEEHFRLVEAIDQGETFRKQGEWWLNHVQNRKRKPITEATASGFRSYLKNWLRPEYR